VGGRTKSGHGHGLFDDQASLAFARTAARRRLRPIQGGNTAIKRPKRLAVWEPASLTIIGSALVGLGWFGRRRRMAS
jgi:hypothetical protein